MRAQREVQLALHNNYYIIAAPQILVIYQTIAALIAAPQIIIKFASAEANKRHIHCNAKPKYGMQGSTGPFFSSGFPE